MDVNPTLFEGKFTGTFDIHDIDADYLNYGGRYVVVLVADYSTISISETKNGDVKQTMGLKVIDASVVTSKEEEEKLLKEHYLTGADPNLPGFDFADLAAASA